MLKTRMGKVNRGVHILPAAEAVAEDPLGHRRRPPTGSASRLTVTVLPPHRLPRAPALSIPRLGLRHDWSGQQGPAHARGLRVPRHPASPTGRAAQPHRLEEHGQDRDPDAPRDGGAGRRRHHPAARRHRRPGGRRGRPTPTSSWPCAPQAASPTSPCAPGAASASSATSGTAAQVRLTADGGGRRALLRDPGRDTAQRHGPAGERAAPPAATDGPICFAAAERHRGQHLPGPPVGRAHSSAFGRTGCNWPSSTWWEPRSPGQRPAEAVDLLPFLPPRDAAATAAAALPAPQRHLEAAESAGAGASLSAEARALLLSLSSAGIPCLTLARGDDLVRSLSVWHSRTAARPQPRCGRA